MTRAISLLVVILFTSPVFAEEAGPAPKVPLPKASVAPGAKPQPTTPDGKQIQLPPEVPGKVRVPIEGRIPISERRVTRPSSLPPETASAEGLRHALNSRLRVNGSTAPVDLRGEDAPVARVEWELDGRENDLAVVLVRRDSRNRCPSSGTSLDEAHRQLQSDSSILGYGGWSDARGSNRTQFSGPPYNGLTEAYVYACGIRGNALNGVVTNTVHVQIGSVHEELRIPVARWYVEWSHDTSSNPACRFGGLDTRVIPAPRGPSIGFRSDVSRGDGPVPCIRDTLYEYQPSAGFDLTGLPSEARIIRAELRFTETDPESHSLSGRHCTAATRRVGMALSPVGSGERVVDTVSGRADAAQSPSASSASQRSVEVSDWVRAWREGRDAGVTFLGLEARREGAACMAQLANVHISIEYD